MSAVPIGYSPRRVNLFPELFHDKLEVQNHFIVLRLILIVRMVRVSVGLGQGGGDGGEVMRQAEAGGGAAAASLAPPPA